MLRTKYVHVCSEASCANLGLLAFGVPGVKEYGYFLKDVRDARAIRSRILECTCFLSS